MLNFDNSTRLSGFAKAEMTTREIGSKKTKVTQFQIATNTNRKVGDNWETFTEWHTLEAWGSTAEYVSKYLKKGSSVDVEGKIEYNSYDKVYGEGKNAVTVKHTRAIIRVNEIRIRNKKEDAS